MHFDTGSSDLWVPSSKCKESCEKYQSWRKYDQSLSSSYRPASTNEIMNAFYIDYEDGESASGENAIDTLMFGKNLTIPRTVFAQIDSLTGFQSCAGEEGVLGLSRSKKTSHNFPTILSKLEGILRNPFFSMYLDGSNDDFSDGENREKTSHAMNSHSQLVFGGVNSKHYEGCLKWYDTGATEEFDAEGQFLGYWDFTCVNF